MLDDPSVNFAISRRSRQHGVNHLGMQSESDAELKDMRVRMIEAQAPALEQREASCCYAKSDKYWTVDPQGIAWESFYTLGTVPVYGEDGRSDARKPEKKAACRPFALGVESLHAASVPRTHCGENHAAAPPFPPA